MYLGDASFSHERKFMGGEMLTECAAQWDGQRGYGQDTTNIAVIFIAIFAFGSIFFKQSNV